MVVDERPAPGGGATLQWNEIKGHEFPVGLLTRALERERISHAYLFVGPAGVGKATVARLFLQSLLCEGSENGRACGDCRTCRRVQRGLHPDVHWTQPDGDVVRIEQIRELQSALSLKPFEATRKGAVIDGADLMTPAAQNCLLKVLEEPPGETVIVLVAANGSALLPTIWSRCQVLRFHPLPRGVVETALVQTGVDASKARLLAAVTDGRLGAALEAAEQDIVAQRDRIAGWVDDLAESGLGLRAVLRIGQALEQEREEIEESLNLFLLWLRDLVLLKEGVTGALANQDVEGRLRALAEQTSVNGLSEAMRAIDHARRRLEANANFRLTIDVMLAKVQRSLVS